MAATPREVQHELEFRKCAKDPVYFLNKYWNIEVIGKGYSVAGLRQYQVADVRTFEKACKGDARLRQVRLKARQIGYTTIACGFGFHNGFFNPHHPWLAAQQSEDEAKKTLLGKVRIPYMMLPQWLRDKGPRLTVDNTEEMAWDNGSSFSAIHSGAAAARGRAVYGAIMDESAFMENAEALFAALDPLTYGPLFLFSTANGLGNFFADTWQDAELVDSEWERGFHSWSVVPGRDQKWYEQMRRRYRGREWLFFQEYPSTPAEAFAKSGRTAFPLDLLENEHDWGPPNWRLDMALLNMEVASGSRVTAAVEVAMIEPGDERDFELHVWVWPYVERDDWGVAVRQPNFVVSADVSEGLEDLDYSTICVWDANTLEVCATLKAYVPVEDLGSMIEWLAWWYYTALVAPERNNQGLVPLTYLQARQYPRLLRMDSVAQIRRGDRTPRYGWHTNRGTKPKMVIEFAKAIRDGAVILHDARLLQECRVFLSDGTGSYAASPGSHDDLIMAALIGYQACLDVGKYPQVWKDHVKRPITIGEVLDITMPKAVQKGASPLYRPIGQSYDESWESKRSWEMLPQNVLSTPAASE